MPTQPFEALLYRDMSKVTAKEIINIASPLLQELVNYGTNAFRRCETSATGNENEDIAVLMLYLHIIEMTDGVEVLISQSCPVPAEPLTRSIFEALLSIEYILEADYVQRSLSWLAMYVHNRIDSYEPLDTSSPKGLLFQKALADDKTARDITLPAPLKVQAAIANLQHMLARTQFQTIEAEIKLQTKRRKPNWYQLFGGPKNLRELARHLKREAQYVAFYGHWSTISHAQDMSRFIRKTPDGEGAFKILRDPNGIRGITLNTANMILNATRLVLDRFRPGEDMANWYKREIRERFLMFVGKDAG
jgi:hypothetical protein